MLFKLIVVHGQPQGKSLVFPRGEFVIGRGEECHIRPNSYWVSRQHCILRVGPDSAYLRDLGSANGTLVNGQRLIGERQVAHGDQVQIGPLVFEVWLQEIVCPARPEQVETGVHDLETAEASPLPSDPAQPESADVLETQNSASEKPRTPISQ
jgi:pSer/pThr/pTyr-binding forkhead associated (FHA) protein